MQAIVQAGYGSADVLRRAEIDKPVVGDDEVLIRVQAAGLDRGTWHLMAGQPYLVRLVSGLRTPKSPVPGLDVASTVVATGAAVTRFKAGDQVFGISKGSFAEYAPARQDKLVSKPANLPSSRPQPSRSPGSPRCRACATPVTFSKASTC